MNKNKIIFSLVLILGASLLIGNFVIAGSSPWAAKIIDGLCSPNSAELECKYPQLCTVFQTPQPDDTCALYTTANQADCSGNSWLKKNKCPSTDDSLNGKTAVLWGGPKTSGSVFTFKFGDLADSGVWDASESKLVTCNGYTEDKIWATSSELRCTSANGVGFCDPQTGDGQCESACGAGDGASDTFLDEKESYDAFVKSVNCPTTVKSGSSFTISYKTVPYETSSFIYTGHNEGTSVVKDKEDFLSSYKQRCTYYSGSATVKAPTLTGPLPKTYTYFVGIASNPYIDKLSDSKTCDVKVAKCLDKENDLITKLNSDCISEKNIKGTCSGNTCQYADDCGTGPDTNRICADGFCCTGNIPGPGQAPYTCVPKGEIKTSRYLCT